MRSRPCKPDASSRNTFATAASIIISEAMRQSRALRLIPQSRKPIASAMASTDQPIFSTDPTGTS